MFSRKHIGVVAALVAVGLVAAGVLVVGDEQPVAPVTQPAPRGLDDQGDLRLIRQTPTRIVLGWTPELTSYGYLFSGDGTVVARTTDPARSTATFRNIYASYEVAAIDKGDTGTYSPLAGTLTMTVTAETANTITFGWTPQAEYGYLFSGDGDVISRTYDPDRSYAKFNKIYTDYEVAVLVKGVTGTYPEAAPPAGTANLWIDTNGGTCSRSGSPIEWPNNGTECDTFDEAYEAASCGDTVLIKGGTYAGQDMNGSKSCTSTWTMGATHGATCTSCVDFKVAPGESVTTSGRNDFSASHVIIEKGSGTNFLAAGGIDVCTAVHDLIMRDLELTLDWFLNCATEGPFDNIALIGGEIHGFNLEDPGQTLAVYMQTNATTFDGVIATDIVIDGVYFHDIPTPDTGDHTGMIRTDGGYDGVWIRNNTFINTESTTSIYQTTFLSQYNSYNPSNINVINNYFGATGGGAPRAINYNSALTSCTDYRILYNTSLDPLYLFGCTVETNFVTAGNAAPWAVGADCAGTHVKNYWQGSASGCGTDQNTAGSLGLGGFGGFEVQPGSVLLGAGETTYCPAADHDGEARPQPGATNCDVGADEEANS